MSSISFNNVSKYYNNIYALSSVNLDIKKGEFIALVGHSGAGKTTLFNLILGDIKPDEGKVFRGKKDLNEADSETLLSFRRKTGTIFQDFRLLSDKTVYENVAFVMEALGYSENRIKNDVLYALELVDLKDKIGSFPDDLSGGEKQRVSIARAIITQPDIILADEPTGNLDPINSREVINILQQINKQGTTVIISTHDKDIIDLLNVRTITITNGEIALDDKTGKYIL